MRRWVIVSLAVVTTTAGLVGCSPAPDADPPQTPSPTPTYYCTPDTGGESSECSADDHAEQQRRDGLYAEATQSYQRFFDEHTKLLRAGGAEKATNALAAVAGGPYLEATVANLRQLHGLQARAGDGDIALHVTRSPGATARGYEIALSVCVDSRGVPLLQGDVEVKPGSAYAETVFFKREAGTLKAWDAEGRRVESC